MGLGGEGEALKAAITWARPHLLQGSGLGCWLLAAWTLVPPGAVGGVQHGAWWRAGGSQWELHGEGMIPYMYGS